MLDMLREHNVRVIYIGDGRGDYCPATRLTASDVVLARRSDGKAYGLWEKLQEGPVAAAVRSWTTGEDLHHFFVQQLGMREQPERQSQQQTDGAGVT